MARRMTLSTSPPTPLTQPAPRRLNPSAFALIDGNIAPLAVSGIDLPRPRDFLLRVAQQLLPLRQPPRRARNRKQYREHIERKADRLIDQAGVEIDVRVQLARDEVVVLEGDA